MVSMNITGFSVNRIFIDLGSSVNILFKKTLDELGLRQLQLEPFHTPIYGFGNDQVAPLERIKLPIMISTSLCIKTQMIDFLVVITRYCIRL